MSEVVIRVLDLAEIEALLGWAKAEGWNPGLADAAPFQTADPQGFIGCFVDGVMAAGISAVRYGSAFGFIGLYIAHADFRGRGYGKRVWDAGIVHLTGRTIGLDGVPEQQGNYRSMGPILAADFGAARDLLFSCAIEAKGEVLHIDVPAGQIEFSDLLDREGFARGFRTTRMYRGTPPSFDTAGVFAVTTLELG